MLKRSPQEELEENIGPEEEPQQCNVTEKRWKSCLGFPTDKVLANTLEATTQLRAEPVEMENRDFPRQHRKKRLPSLHVRRIPGRVDTDTFYSTVKSKRKYTCVQLFVCVESKFVFIRCMKRER